ncbi:Gamma-aminobutyric acid (GABA) B receptor [Seminavis robusta]|uniref:Gamma-aminobutyric acid (GABA) B receptor n=1 Tax=Seminavis robusta TaxID=568900 RepID=A0A9N8F4P6_9STRA|nr:Gamma-aminobutyric acid (GABA) B receptor [Seminavis robusta]|eukprot:Sro3778_g350980.1 Gamma-aminobutyric acid (GABA) B receptor (613) ;mRNA; r:2397-4235
MIGYWWHPDVFPSEFLASPAEFTHVSLPPPSVACMSAREGVNLLHCDADVEKRIGSALTVCDDPPMLLSKLLSTTIFDSIKDPTLPQGIVSPSHSVLANYRLSSIQLDEIFFIWNRRGDAREAVCEWIVDNMDHLEELIPRTYPRAFQKKDHAPLMYASTLLGAIVVVLVLVTLFLVHRNQNRRSVKYSQIEFLVLLLVGSLFIGVGAIVIGIPSTNASCIVEVWLINIGYTLELVPLIVKVAAVNHIMSVGKKMRRSRLDRRYLFGVVATICTLLVIFLILWSVLDTPKVMQEYELTETKNEDGETIVWVLDVCGSESNAWVIISVGWNALLLLCTTTLAVQMRKVGMEGFRETGTLALLVYSHSVFVVLRLFTYLLSSVMKEYFLSYCRSFLFSVDTLSTLVIYFIPKLFGEDIQRRGSTISIASLQWTANLSDNNAPPWIQKQPGSSDGMQEWSDEPFSGHLMTSTAKSNTGSRPREISQEVCVTSASGSTRRQDSIQEMPHDIDLDMDNPSSVVLDIKQSEASAVEEFFVETGNLDDGNQSGSSSPLQEQPQRADATRVSKSEGNDIGQWQLKERIRLLEKQNETLEKEITHFTRNQAKDKTKDAMQW